jgi:hypothetical protein
MLAGNISSQSMLFAKSGLELIILTVVFDENQLQYALTWILLVMMVLTAILQVRQNIPFFLKSVYQMTSLITFITSFII